MDALFDIRDMGHADVAAVNALAALEGFGMVDAHDAVRVAVNDEGEVVGFSRFVFDGEGVAHVNPVAVYASWRRYGVARALMDEALRLWGELRLVSRGESLPFYDALGFQRCDWKDIAPSVVAECDACELRDECGPVPMRCAYAPDEDADSSGKGN